MLVDGMSLDAHNARQTVHNRGSWLEVSTLLLNGAAVRISRGLEDG